LTQKEAHTERTEKSALPNLIRVAATEKKYFELLAKAQTELFNKLAETNRQWLDRMQVEANSVSEFASKLTASRSIPDAMTACQEWANRCLEMMAEDRKHVLDDYQRFAETGARLLATGWQQLKGSEIGA
jgi:hypothetical protein